MERAGSGDGRSSSDWPCPAPALEAGRAFLKAAVTRGRIVLAPDKDADGLSAGTPLPDESSS